MDEVISSGREISCILIRHGKTKGNIEKRYVGCRTDEELCQAGIEELKASPLKDTAFFQGLADSNGGRIQSEVYISPMIRCRQTAQILFPDCRQIALDGFKEIDFGNFEYKNYMELTDNADYQAWIDSDGTIAFPKGESREEFVARNISTFRQLLVDTGDRITGTLPFVIHGGSIMAIMSELTGNDYYDFQIGCGDAYLVRLSINEDRIDVLSYDRLYGRGDS